MTDDDYAEVEIVADTTAWDEAFKPRVRTLGPGQLRLADGTSVPLLGASITESPAWHLVDLGYLWLYVPDAMTLGMVWDRTAAIVTTAVEHVASVFSDLIGAFGTLTVTMQHVNPELWRLLFKPRRGWKGHGAPPLYELYPWEPLPAKGRPRKTTRVGW